MEPIEELRAALAQLTARVRELEDEREIRELLSRYAYEADSMRDGEWLALWSGADADAYDLSSTVLYPDGSSRTLERVWSGADGLHELISDPEGHHRPGFYGHSMHTALNIAVRVDGDTAAAHTYSLLYQEHDGRIELVSAASNEWMLVRVQGRWRIQQRHRGQVATPTFRRHLGTER